MAVLVLSISRKSISHLLGFLCFQKLRTEGVMAQSDATCHLLKQLCQHMVDLHSMTKAGAVVHASAIQLKIWVMAPSKTTKQPEKFSRNLETKTIP